MPPPPGMAGALSFSGRSTTTLSVVSSSPAMEAAFCSAVRVTSAGSQILASGAHRFYHIKPKISLSSFKRPDFMDFKIYLERRIVTELIHEVHRTGDRLADTAQSQLHHEVRERIAVMIRGEPGEVETVLEAVRAKFDLPPASSSRRILRRSFLRRLLEKVPAFWPFTE